VNPLDDYGHFQNHISFQLLISIDLICLEWVSWRVMLICIWNADIAGPIIAAHYCLPAHFGVEVAIMSLTNSK
jgi:hypothetical protein